MKTVLTIYKFLFFAFLVSCTGHAPKIEKPVSFYLGVSDTLEYCRMDSKKISDVAQLSHVEKGLFKRIIKINDNRECFYVGDREFDTMVLISVADLEIILNHARDLKYQCKKWKK